MIGFAVGENSITLKALSVRPPWSHYFFLPKDWKDVENRTWYSSHRGPLLIHAAKTPDGEVTDEMHRGGIVGVVNMIDCRKGFSSRWAMAGQYQWVFRNPMPLPFRPFRGRQGLFNVTFTDDWEVLKPLRCWLER